MESLGGRRGTGVIVRSDVLLLIMVGKVGDLEVSSAASLHIHAVNAAARPSASRCFTLMSSGQGDHPVIISTLYLPEITVNVRYQCVLLRSVCAGQTNSSVMTGTVW